MFLSRFTLTLMQPELIQRWLMRTVLLFWGLTKATGWNMWMAERKFPLAPPFDWMYQVPPVIHLLLVLAAFWLMSWLFFQPERLKLIPVLLLVTLLSDSLDQNRWQPWEYLFATLLLVVYINRRNTDHLLHLFLFVLAALYFYSGVSKFHTGFLYASWHPLFLKQVLHFEQPLQNPFLFYLGYSIPLLETVAALGLLFRRSRRAAAVFFMLMHATLLLLIGPTGLNYNWIIWPWNLGMMALLYLSAFKIPHFSFKPVILVQKSNVLFTLAWGVLPLAFYLNGWDAYLSAQLYSGRIHHAAICVPGSKIPPDLQRYVVTGSYFQAEKGTIAISLNQWAMGETNVPTYPEIRVFRKIKSEFDKQFPGTDAVLTVIRYPFTRKEVLRMR